MALIFSDFSDQIAACGLSGEEAEDRFRLLEAYLNSLLDLAQEMAAREAEGQEESLSSGKRHTVGLPSIPFNLISAPPSERGESEDSCEM